ncbi:MAG: hypothetical protein ACLVJH_03245 [Faecalibacterium prausnitzii]
MVSYGGAPEADAVLRRVAAQQNAPFTEVDFAKLQITGGDLDAVTFSFDGLDGGASAAHRQLSAPQRRAGHYRSAGAAAARLEHPGKRHPHRVGTGELARAL